MLVIGKTIRSATFVKKVNCGNISNFGNIWNIRNIDMLHDDFNTIQRLNNEQFNTPFVITENHPPFCTKCEQYVKNKCIFSPIRGISIRYFNFTETPNLNIQCPIFGEVRAIFAIDNLDETISKKSD
jgi:hypothetical protein